MAAKQIATPSSSPPVLSSVTLDRGVKLLGHLSSLDSLFARLHAGKPITLGVLGASVGQNGGCFDQPGKRCMGYKGRRRGEPIGFAVRLLRHINKTWPADHRINNSALDGTGVEHVAKCIVSHLPPSVNIVVAEWGSMAIHTANALPSIERATRVLLSRPNPPILVHLSVHEWCSQRISPRSLYRVGDVLKGSLRNYIYPDTPWAAVEEEATRVSRHYGQAAVSVHTALAPHVLGGEPGFHLLDVTGEDCLHPVNGRRGIEYVESLLTHWFDRSHALWHYAKEEARYLLAPRNENGMLPPPLHAANAEQRMVTRCYAFVHETATEAKQLIMAKVDWCSRPDGSGESGTQTDAACWSAMHGQCPPKIRDTAHSKTPLVAGSRQALRASASQAAYASFMANPPRHWFYCGISLGDLRRKISAGVVAMVPGARLRARVQGWGSQFVSDEAEVQVELLTSYNGMGIARLECLGGCECEPQTIDAHKTNGIRNVSVFEDYGFIARARRGVGAEGEGATTTPCELLVTVLKRTSSGAHKLKLRSITVTTNLPNGTAAAVPPPPSPKSSRSRRRVGARASSSG